MKSYAIIPAGGKGTRLNSSIPKQYLKIDGKYLIEYTLQPFQECKEIDSIIISAEKRYFGLIEEIKTNNNFDKIIQIVEGGNSRQESVFNALSTLKASHNDLIVVHDAARPLLSLELLSEGIKKAKLFDNVVTAVGVKDTIFKASDYVEKYISRENIYYAQTPQIFRYENIKDAFDQAIKNKFIGTDESMLVQAAGYKVYIIEGNPKNLKVTTDEDIKLMSMLLFHNE